MVCSLPLSVSSVVVQAKVDEKRTERCTKKCLNGAGREIEAGGGQERAGRAPTKTRVTSVEIQKREARASRLQDNGNMRIGKGFS